MKERPIIFSAPMVRALLDGRKTQTRRIIKPQPEVDEHGNLCGEWLSKPLDGLLLPKLQDIVIHCPLGEIGDRLWVRETFVRIDDESGYGSGYTDYKASHDHPWQMIWKSPIFMPRWASRITLEITNIRVERLNDISEEDAIAEGVSSIEEYKVLWKSINKLWDPWIFVWVIQFQRLI